LRLHAGQSPLMDSLLASVSHVVSKAAGHVGFALAAASRYYVMEAGRITSTGAGGADAHADVRAAMAI